MTVSTAGLRANIGRERNPEKVLRETVTVVIGPVRKKSDVDENRDNRKSLIANDREKLPRGRQTTGEKSVERETTRLRRRVELRKYKI